MTIGKVSRLIGVGIETIRFYEREGLIPKPPRSASGYRHYASDTIDKLHFIKKAKGLGFTLVEIKELLFLQVNSKTTCADVKRKATKKIKEVEDKITDLKRIKRALVKVTDQCRGSGPGSECPILENLESRRRRS